MVLSRAAAAFLIVAGAFPLLIWPNFLRIVATDERAFDDGPTAFLLVHAALGVASMSLGLGLVVLGVKAWRRAPRRVQDDG